jgi:hypothetical protein
VTRPTVAWRVPFPQVDVKPPAPKLAWQCQLRGWLGNDWGSCSLEQLDGYPARTCRAAVQAFFFSRALSISLDIFFLRRLLLKNREAFVSTTIPRNGSYASSEN